MNKIEIDFDGNVLALVVIENSQIVVLKAVNRCGEKIDTNQIKIKEIKRSNK